MVRERRSQPQPGAAPDGDGGGGSAAQGAEGKVRLRAPAALAPSLAPSPGPDGAARSAEGRGTTKWPPPPAAQEAALRAAAPRRPRSLPARPLLPAPLRRAAGRSGDRSRGRAQLGGTDGLPSASRGPSGCCSPAAAGGPAGGAGRELPLPACPARGARAGPARRRPGAARSAPPRGRARAAREAGQGDCVAAPLIAPLH